MVQIPDEPPPPLTNLVWKLPPRYATLEGDRLVVDIPTDAHPADAVATATLPAELFAGAEGFSMTVSADGSSLARPTREWLGLKFQVHWRESATGREGWPNARSAIGDLPPTVLRNDASFKGAHPDAVTLELGLQGTSGRVVFDLSTLRGGPSEGLFRRINRDWIVRYPDEARRPPLRGCMLPTRDTTEDDIETLHRWGATLARFQICRGWTRRDANQDLEDFAAWVDSRLDNLADVLRWAEARHHARIYVGEFSAIAWAEGAENYLRDCIELFEEYGWDWTYHAFREWAGWSVEHEGPDPKHLVPAEDTPRKRVLLDGFAGRMQPAGPSE